MSHRLALQVAGADGAQRNGGGVLRPLHGNEGGDLCHAAPRGGQIAGHTGLATRPSFHCKAFEDNSGALEIARLPKMRPRTKHINTKYHHFREYVASGKVSLHAVKSEDQLADCLTKPLGPQPFQELRRRIMGW